MGDTRFLRAIEATSVVLFLLQALRVAFSVLFGIIYDQVFAGSPDAWLPISVGLLVLAVAVPALAPRNPSHKWLAAVACLDPYPFVMLTTILSLEAIFLTITVLISQIRQNQTTTLRSELQLQVSLITEKELTKVLKLVRMILRKQGVDVQNDAELEAMVDEIDASYIESKLEEEIVPSKPTIVEKIAEKVSPKPQEKGK